MDLQLHEASKPGRQLIGKLGQVFLVGEPVMHDLSPQFLVKRMRKVVLVLESVETTHLLFDNGLVLIYGTDHVKDKALN